MAGARTAQRGKADPPQGGPKGKTRSGGSSSSDPKPAGPRRIGPVPLRAVLALAAAALFAGAAAWVLYGSQWLRVERVGVAGTEVLTPRQVREAAAVPLGSPLASIDTAVIESRLLSHLPRIESVEVVRAWPHGIGLKVTERKPVLLVARGAEFLEVDAAGVRFATVSKPPKGIPLLELDARRSPSLRRFDEQRLLHEAVDVAGSLPPVVARDTRVIQVSSYDSVVLELTRSRKVVWGSGEQGAAKARALSALLKVAPDGRRFDVSAPTAPAVSGS
ncbi:cell division protein FtsQ/DivIB [Streptomyces sp. NPDC006879]|uniref:cell division protein FtsQ/DivIB n=1 Tax=Streptomyces sp. NPDC006879 TaxID=3364767 RepID=UPI003677EDB0